MLRARAVRFKPPRLSPDPSGRLLDGFTATGGDNPCSPWYGASSGLPDGRFDLKVNSPATPAVTSSLPRGVCDSFCLGGYQQPRAVDCLGTCGAVSSITRHSGLLRRNPPLPLRWTESGGWWWDLHPQSSDRGATSYLGDSQGLTYPSLRFLN